MSWRQFVGKLGKPDDFRHEKLRDSDASEFLHQAFLSAESNPASGARDLGKPSALWGREAAIELKASAAC
jgi:hypothetical protein